MLAVGGEKFGYVAENNELQIGVLVYVRFEEEQSSGLVDSRGHVCL